GVYGEWAEETIENVHHFTRLFCQARIGIVVVRVAARHRRCDHLFHVLGPRVILIPERVHILNVDGIAQVLYQVERRHSHIRRPSHRTLVFVDVVRQLGKGDGVIRQLAPEHIVLVDLGFVLVQAERTWPLQEFDALAGCRVEIGA
ncbi:unnamed protein product, partial [Ectocarpus sp. 12 AP-2014]